MSSTGLVALANSESWTQVGELVVALVLSAIIGIEREIRQKSAGLRTHSLVGIGAALFMLISKYGFDDVVHPGRVVADPSRVAAQIVSGIGFIGAGIIFVRRDSVRGLTTAGAVWVTAAVGAAAGAGLPTLAAIGTGLYLVVATAFTPLVRRLPHSSSATSVLRVRYADGKGVLRRVIEVTTSKGFTIEELSNTVTVENGGHGSDTGNSDLSSRNHRSVEVTLAVHGKPPLHDLAAVLADVEYVESVVSDDINATTE
jgi:putative Mg2+ transporter-C (MgtC) family protein